MDEAMRGALARVAPRLDLGVWTGPLDAAFARFEITSPRRQATALGQFLVEAYSNFGCLEEGLNYPSAQRILDVFGTRFTDLESARPYVNNPVGLANFVYANREGNGDVGSGDGWRYRGRGLIQLTFRDNYQLLAEAAGVPFEQITAFCETPAGAAMCGCWFLYSRGCQYLADAWRISEITRRVNPSMRFAEERLAYSNRILEIVENG